MLVIILFAVLWLALLVLLVRALGRNHRPTLRICRDLEPRRYRPAGRKGRCLRYRWSGEDAAPAPTRLSASAESTIDFTPHTPIPRRKKGVPAFGIVMGINAALVVVIAVLLWRGYAPKPSADPDLIASSAASSESAQSESTPAEPEATPEPTPEATPEPNNADPLMPECSLYDGSDYAAGTWLKVELNEEDTCSSPILTVSVSDLGTGEELWHSEEAVTHDDDISYCLEEPNNYVITAYVTNAAGVQSEYLTLTVKVYAV